MSRDKRRAFQPSTPVSPKPNIPAVQPPMQVKQIIGETYSGPIPHPDTLARYDQIQKGFADRIVSMAESESLHRREHETKALQSDIEVKQSLIRERTRGQWCALTIALCSIIGACLMAYWSQPVPATALVGTAAAGMVSAFLYRQKKPPEPR